MCVVYTVCIFFYSFCVIKLESGGGGNLLLSCDFECLVFGKCNRLDTGWERKMKCDMSK